MSCTLCIGIGMKICRENTAGWLDALLLRHLFDEPVQPLRAAMPGGPLSMTSRYNYRIAAICALTACPRFGSVRVAIVT